MKYVTEQEKVEALANHFESVHQLTHKSVSIMEAVVNQTYNEYNTNEPAVMFNDEMVANFIDEQREPSSNNTDETTNLQEMFTSTKELNQIIKSRNNKKSSGMDKTSNFVLKKMPNNFITALSIIMNHIINTQYIPNAWKLGVITAISKANKDSSLITSYRPITQLSVISKILEKKIELRIRSHCQRNNIINPSLFGFQPGKSTEMAAGKFLTEITKGLNERMPTIAVLLDFQAAFDTLWQKALIYKMHKMNFEKNVICLVKNYLIDRSFVVRMGNSTSQTKPIAAGAPQGGVLSAIFYLIYTNDFPKPRTTTTPIQRIMFADDTIIFTVTDKIKQAQKDMNEYLQKIANYVSCWKLKLNEKKTELISIVGYHKDLSKSVRKNALNIDLKINGTNIIGYKKVKYLGIVISSNFKFIEHVNHMLNKVNLAKCLLKRAFNDKCLNKGVKLLMYKQLIRPIILYASACWMQISSNQMEKIRRVERSILRKATGIYKNITTKKYVNSKTLYQKSKINRIDRKLIETNLKFIERVRNNENSYIQNIVEFSENYIVTCKYKPMSIFWQLNQKKQLFENNKLLLFNRGSRDPNKLLYVTNQNETAAT